MLPLLQDGLGLDIVVWIQAHGNGLFDFIARALHLVGGNPFYLLVIALIYWRSDRRLGVRLLFALLLAIFVTTLAKELFRLPRPYHAHPEQVMALVAQVGYGLPSGHVLNVVVIWGYVALWLNQQTQHRWLYWLIAAYALLMAWARMYTGVHYPQDVVGGAILGVMTLWLYWHYSDRAGQFWRALNRPRRVILVLSVILLALLFFFRQ
jgi:membrane-associated phospholipid phosphatase